MDTSKLEEIKGELKNSIYVMLSTQNQMVNFLPLKVFEFRDDKILNITTNHPSNEEWDQNLKSEELKVNPVDLKLDHNDLLNIKGLKSNIRKALKINKKFCKESKVFWNITGGQRPLILAVYDLVKELKDKTHYICYLEGNSGSLRILKFEGGIPCPKFDGRLTEYKTDEISLKVAFNLMGYDVKSVSKAELQKKDEKSLKDLYFLFKEEENGELRRALVKSNKKGESFKDVKGKLPQELHDLLDRHSSKSAPFGYLLEDMIVTMINEFVGERVAEVAHSVKLAFSSDDANKEVGNKQLDEFDILMLSKKGQLTNFECKSGGMSGDVAKSTKYSTYAVAGVYGKPILITPLTKKEIDDIKELDNSIYSTVKAAIRSALRSKLEVWGIDEIEEEVKKLL